MHKKCWQRTFYIFLACSGHLWRVYVYKCVVSRAVTSTRSKNSWALFLSSSCSKRAIFKFLCQFFFTYLLAHFGKIKTLCTIFCHSFTAHQRKRLIVRLLSNFWHRHWIQRLWIPKIQGYFCQPCSVQFPVTLSWSHPVSVCIRVLDKILDGVLEQ